MSETRPDGKSAGLFRQSGSSISGKLYDDRTVLFQHSQGKLQFLALEKLCILQTELQIYRALAKHSCAIMAKALVLFFHSVNYYLCCRQTQYVEVITYSLQLI